MHDSTELPQKADQRIRNRLRSTFGYRPSHYRCGSAQYQADRRTNRSIKCEHRVSNDTAKKRASSFPMEAASEYVGRQKGVHSKLRHQKRMRGKVKRRPQGVLGKIPPTVGKGTHQRGPPLPVSSQLALLVVKCVLQHYRRAVIERVGKRCIAVDPLKAELSQRE